MKFNDTTGNLGIVQEVKDLCSISSDDNASYLLTSIARRLNSALETMVGLIIAIAGTWQWDDTNFDTLPIGTGTLTEGQSSYTFADEYLDIEEVDVLDLNGVYRRLTPFDPSEMRMSWDEWTHGRTGLPRYYDKLGDSIRFDTSASATYMTLAAGIKVRFSRTASLFTGDNSDSDNNKTPGIVSTAHETLAQMIALPYQKTYLPDRVAQTERDIQAGQDSMVAFYSRRQKDKRKKATMRRLSPR